MKQFELEFTDRQYDTGYGVVDGIILIDVTIKEIDASFDHALGTETKIDHEVTVLSGEMFLIDRDGGETGSVVLDADEVELYVDFEDIEHHALIRAGVI